MKRPKCIRRTCRAPNACKIFGYCKETTDHGVVSGLLLSLAKDYEKAIVYYIKVDKTKGDDEGANLKSFTLHRVREIIKTAEAVGIK